jgi:aminoglycoside phosphotransferase (APT) family kinase protein
MQRDTGRPGATDRLVCHDPVDKILAAYRVSGPWQRLEGTGVANRIYATQDVILRVATDHPEAIADALTESIASPVARDAGILTPQLIAFDDSKTLVDRPFSLWERVHGETLGLWDLRPNIRESVWREVGQQIARLHDRVRSCPDPNGYLDTPGRELRLDLVLMRFADSGHASSDVVREIEHLISDLNPFVWWGSGSKCFVHNDLHEWNIMCGRQGGLLALIDWGDAGWGDPTLDFAAVPLDSISAALEGHDLPERLGDYAEARFVWDHLHNALDDAIDNPKCTVPIGDYRRFLDRA